MNFDLYWTKTALKQLKNIKAANLSDNLDKLILILRNNPFQNPPDYEKLCGNLKGIYSRRINIQHRVLYSVDKKTKAVKILSVWSHYEY